MARPAESRPFLTLGVRSALLALLIGCTLLLARQFFVVRADLLEEVQTQAAIIAANSAAPLLFNDRNAAAEVLATVALTQKIQAAALYRQDGQLLATSAADDDGPFAPHYSGGAAATLSGGIPLLRTQGELRQPVLLRERQVGTLLLHFSLRELYLSLASFALSLLLIGGAAMGLAYRMTGRLRQRIRRAEEQLVQHAYYDPVSGLPNRRYFEQELRRVVRSLRHYPRGGALCFIDLDDFKKINDTLGHAQGDVLLEQIGERLRSAVRASDIVARLGGDEFAVLLLDAGDPGEISQIASNMLEQVTRPLTLSGTPVHPGISIGIALLPGDARDAETLLRRADQAMYVVKESGKHGFHFYSSEIDERVQFDLHLENDFRQALAENQGLWVAYQPQFCARSRRCIGLEALVRWQRADGLISPARFVPVLERSGLINALGEWVFARVCADLGEMRRQGLAPPRVAINLSPRQLLRGTAVFQAYQAILARYAESPASFELELTEGALLEARGRGVLDAFRHAGFELAIDDFGTGYSSLGYLRSFGARTLKIDRSFIARLPGAPEDEAIVRAIIDVARALDIRVVAEGVENEAQAAFLSALDCDVLQGFLLGRPVPLAELAALLRSAPDQDEAGTPR